MFMFKPVFNWVLKYCKNYQCMKMLVCVGVWKFWKIFWWGMKSWREIWMGHEFFGEKIIFPSSPVPGINNDQCLANIHPIARFLSYEFWLLNFVNSLVFKFTVLYIHYYFVCYTHVIHRLSLKKNGISVRNIVISYSVFCRVVIFTFSLFYFTGLHRVSLRSGTILW